MHTQKKMGVVSIGDPSQRTGIGGRLHLRMLKDWACLKAEGGGQMEGPRRRGETAQVVKGKKLNHWHLHRAGGAGLKLMVHQEGQDGPWNGPHTAREGSS